MEGMGFFPLFQIGCFLGGMGKGGGLVVYEGRGLGFLPPFMKGCLLDEVRGKKCQVIPPSPLKILPSLQQKVSMYKRFHWISSEFTSCSEWGPMKKQ